MICQNNRLQNLVIKRSVVIKSPASGQKNEGVLSRSKLNRNVFSSLNIANNDPMSDSGSFMHRRLAAGLVKSPDACLKSPLSPLSDHPVRVYRNKMQIRETNTPATEKTKQKSDGKSSNSRRNLRTTMEKGKQIQSVEFQSRETSWKGGSPKLCVTSCVSI